MDLLATLKFVGNAVANSNFDTSLKHFAIEAGYIRATNNVISLGCPIDFPFDCAPEAERLIKAAKQCKDVVSMSVTQGQRLSVKSGPFKALIPCLDLSEMPKPMPSGQRVEIDGAAMLTVLKTVEAFVCKDSLRPWTNGVLFKGQSAFATNNVCLIEYWMGVEFPVTVNVPLVAIKEILRINEPPSTVLVDHHSMTFMYDDGRWLKTQLLDSNWQDLSRILVPSTNGGPIPDGFFAGLKVLKGFTDNDCTVQICDGELSTGSSDTGASYSVPGLKAGARYRVEMLLLLEGVATVLDMSRTKQPALFFGDRVRGAIIGMTE